MFKKPFGVGRTDIGCMRKNNEDAFFVDNQRKLYIVADGMGGHQAGEVAARITTSLLPRYILKQKKLLQNAKNTLLKKYLCQQVHRNSATVRQQSAMIRAYKGMGATMVMAYVYHRHAQIVHMGDSRAYILRAKHLKQLTADHSIVNLLVKSGEITAKQALQHPAKHVITHFVGMEHQGRPDSISLKIKPGDRLLLCSDGLTDMVHADRLERTLNAHKPLNIICNQLIEQAKSSGGRDNITLVIIDIG